MKNILKVLPKIGFVMLYLALGKSYAQSDTTKLVIDDIQIDLKNLVWDKEKNSATVSLFLISYKKYPRDFRLNTFACQLYDQQQRPHLFDTMQMGKVRITAESRENYLHYLMPHNTPIEFHIEYSNLPSGTNIDYFNLVFEDSKEEGKFLEVYIPIVNKLEMRHLD